MRIHHLAFRSTNPLLLAEFYASVVGLTIVPPGTEGAPEASSGKVWLRAESTLVMVEPRGESEPAPPAGSLELVAFGIEADERERCVARLGARGVTVEAETDFSIYFRDPEGRRVALSHYPDPRARTRTHTCESGET